MSDYELHISSYDGIVPGAVHYRGRVVGSYPKSCHGGTHYNAPGHRGQTTCEQGHVLPERIEWDVEALWTEERYERYAAKQFDGPGPNQFLSEDEVIEAAIARFTGTGREPSWWEEKVVPGRPGDRLYLGHKALSDADTADQWGTVIAEVPA